MCACSAIAGLLALGLPFFLFNGFWFLDYRLMFVFTTVMGWAIPFAYRKAREYMEYLRLQRVTQRKQRERAAQLQVLKGQYSLTPARQVLVAKSPTDLIALLQARDLTALEVFEAFLAKTIDATISFNCVTEFIPDSKVWAQQLDAQKAIKGPLHGLPICIKDDTDVKGMDSTLGYAKNLYKPAAKSAVLVQILLDLGAVPICKTNVPQTLVSFASDNPIFGETVNCLNTALAPGGSSSGTGCLVGAGGVAFGTGTDIGGSGRIPAHFNGICSIKPTSNRISSMGMNQATPNCVGLVGVPAIFSTGAETLAYVLKAITEGNRQNEYDAQALPIPWNSEVFESRRKLRIGFFTNLSFFPLMGDTEKVVLSAKAALESNGHTVVPFPIKNDYSLAKIMGDLANSDTGTYLRGSLYGESLSSAAQMLYRLIHMPYLLRKAISMIFKLNVLPSFLQSQRAPYCIDAGLDLRETASLWDCMGQRQQFISEVLQRMKTESIDCILCPAFPFAAPKLDVPKHLVVAVIYCMLWNLCDFPAGIVKFGKESGTNIKNFKDDGDVLLRIAKKGLRESAGMPIGVQIVGKPYQEEMVLRVLAELDQIANTSKYHAPQPQMYRHSGMEQQASLQNLLC